MQLTIHRALIYLDEEMRFRNSPEDPPFKGRVPLDPLFEKLARRYERQRDKLRRSLTIKYRYSGSRYEPSFPATVPYTYESPIYEPKTDGNMYTYGLDSEYLLKDKGSVAPIDETSIYQGDVSAGRYHSYKGKEREAQSDAAFNQNGVAVKIEPTEPRDLEYNNYNTTSDVDSRFLRQRRKGVPPPLDLAPTFRMYRPAAHSHRKTMPTVRETGYSIPYGESHAYRHRGTRTFDSPRSVNPGRYEMHTTNWKRKLSEEVEDRYTRSRKRSRRN